MGVDCSTCVNPENDLKFSQKLKRHSVKFIFEENNNEETI